MNKVSFVDDSGDNEDYDDDEDNNNLEIQILH